MNVFNSIKEIKRSKKEINSLLSKGMSNICLKVTIEKILGSQIFDVLSLKHLSPSQFWGAPTHVNYKTKLNSRKNINFSKTETKSKMDNPTHICRETNLVLLLI